MADLESAGYYFFFAGKVPNGAFFEGDFDVVETFSTSKIVPSVVRDNFVVKNVETTSKSPEKLRH